MNGGRAQSTVKLVQRGGYSPGLGKAFVVFSLADWEIGIEDQWFVDWCTSPAVVATLSQSIRTGRVTGGNMNNEYVRGQYTSEHDMAPLCARGHLVLRPRRSDNRVDHPELAFVETLALLA